MDSQNRRLIGLIVILVGVMFLLDQLGIGRMYNVGNIIGTFWPILLIMLGLSVIANRNARVGLILLGLGVVFQVSELYGWGFWTSLWPLAVIAVGLMMLIRQPRTPWNSTTSEIVGGKVLHDSIAFWGSDKKVVTDDFQGGSINTLFGGSKIDLRETRLAAQGAQLNVFCAFGGVEILVSDNYRVESYGTAFLGGWDNKFMTSNDLQKPVLRISGTVTFGGVEVKN